MICTITISLLIEKPFYLLKPQIFSFQIVSEFILIHFVSRVGLLTPCFVRIFVHNDCPGKRVFAPFKSCPGFVGGGGGGGGWMKLIPA